MKEQRYDTLEGLSAPILIYESVEEADKVLPGGILTQGNNNMAYRGVLPTVRDIICNLVEEETGVERESKVVGKTKGGKDIVVWEADGKYVKRAMAEKGLEDLKHLQDKVDDACRNFKDGEGAEAKVAPLAVDVKGSERKAPEPKRLAAKYKVAAAKVLVEGTVATVNAEKLTSINKSFTPTGDTTKMYTGSYTDVDGKEKQFNVSDKDAEALGWLVKEWMDWFSTQQLKSSF